MKGRIKLPPLLEDEGGCMLNMIWGENSSTDIQ